MELEQRVRPKQERAKKTYNLILSTAESLLKDVGFEKFTTNKLAEMANLRIRSVYRYFPNKLAIIKTLAERHAENDRQFHQQFSILENPEVNWSEAMNSLIDNYYEMQINTPAYMAARRALSDSPELMEYDDRSVLKLSRKLARSLKVRMPDMDEEKLGIISTFIIDISDTMIYRAHKYLHIRNDKHQASEIIMELKFVLKNYLQSYLD
jgi:AcrR family transcriptional regulator